MSLALSKTCSNLQSLSSTSVRASAILGSKAATSIVAIPWSNESHVVEVPSMVLRSSGVRFLDRSVHIANTMISDQELSNMPSITYILDEQQQLSVPGLHIFHSTIRNEGY